jgi:hypothetical protein
MPGPQGNLFLQGFPLGVWRLAPPQGIPELSPFAPEEVRQAVPTVAVIRQHRSELLPIGLNVQQMFGHSALPNISWAEDEVANCSCVGYERMEPKAEEKLPL